jgi:hypothetical protein
MSADGGQSFCELPALTAILTGSGLYQFSQNFNPDGEFRMMGSRYHGAPLGTPANMAFRQDNPNEMVVASSFTGVFYGVWSIVPGGGCREPEWRDLSAELPTPLPYVSDVAFGENGAVYVATQGRGVLRIDSPAAALPATYFQPKAKASQGSAIAVLRDAQNNLLLWARVRISATDATTGELRLNAVEFRTDENANIILPPWITAGTYKVTLLFMGDGTNGNGSTRFLLTVI